jgi:hypothetical protein
MKWFWATGRISKQKYLQFRDQKYLEYSQFKLMTLQTFGVISARQVRQAWKSQKQEHNPYSFVRDIQREGRITKEEAALLRKSVFYEQKQQKQSEKAAQHEQNISALKSGQSFERGRERSR